MRHDPWLRKRMSKTSFAESGCLEICTFWAQVPVKHKVVSHGFSEVSEEGGHPLRELWESNGRHSRIVE